MNILIGYMNKDLSGINIYLRNTIENINKDNYKITVLTRNYDEELELYLKKYDIELVGIHRNRRFIREYKDISNVLRRNKYDICYFNISESFDCIGIIAALKNNVHKIIAHSHSSSVSASNFIGRYVKLFLNKIFKTVTSSEKITHLACSEEAAKWLYNKRVIENKEYKIINNAIDCGRFAFNLTIRKKLRKKYHIKEDEYVIGHVGAYRKPKNQIFLINLINYLKNNSSKNYKLLLIGNYIEAEDLMKIINDFNLNDNIIFIEETSRVNDFYNMMDIFILPSLFEGFSIVGIEAQANGLPCIFSNNITYKSKMTDLVEYLSLDANYEVWTERIESLLKNYPRKDNKYYLEVVNAGYDIKTEARKFQNKYLKGDESE